MRRTIIGTGVVLVAIASLVWWRTRTEASPAKANVEAARAPVISTMSSQRSPELPTAAVSREAPRVESQINRPATQARIADAHAHLQDAVKPCRALVAQNGSPDAQFQFSYRLALSGGEASISDLSLVWSDYKSAELEKCLLEKLAAARWTSSDADFTTTVEDALTAAELE